MGTETVSSFGTPLTSALHAPASGQIHTRRPAPTPFLCAGSAALFAFHAALLRSNGFSLLALVFSLPIPFVNYLSGAFFSFPLRSSYRSLCKNLLW